MGQAFDRNGNVLGEAFGDTKRDVFDKLNAEFKEAAEIRVRSLIDKAKELESIRHVERNGGISAASTEMPRYRCHKEVWALKIERIEYDNAIAQRENRETDGSALLVFADAGYAPLCVDASYLKKHDPHFGGYYVVYKDGYRSFSPADAFEDGYTRL